MIEESNKDRFLQNIDEVYFGKTPSIQAIENQIDLVRRTYIGSGKNPTNSLEMQKVNRLIEEVFGFGCFNLAIVLDNIPSSATIPIDYSFNANKRNNNFMVDATTYKFKKEYDYTCIVMMTTGLFLNEYFTTREIMACLLYELGHNFYSCMYKNNGILSSIYSAATFANSIVTIVKTFQMSKEYASLMNSIAGKQFDATFSKMMDPETLNTIMSNPKSREMYEKDKAAARDFSIKLSKGVLTGGLTLMGALEEYEKSPTYIKQISKIKDDVENDNNTKEAAYGWGSYVKLAMKKITSVAGSMMLPAMDVLYRIDQKGQKVNIQNIIKNLNIKDILLPYKSLIYKAKNPLTWIILPLGYRQERSADNFPTMYGYGQDAISYFDKIESHKSKGSIASNPLISITIDLITAPAKIINGVFDTKPDGISRAYDQIKMLEYELSKTDLDPKMRATIKSDLELCKKNIKSLVDISKGAKDPDILRKVYNYTLGSIANGTNLKSFIFDDKNKFQKYDDYYNQKLRGN